MEQISEEGFERKRPFGLYIIISLQLINATLLALGLVALEFAESQIRLPVGNHFLFTSFSWVIVIAWILANIGLFRLKRWGWTLTMILTGLSLTLNIWLYFQGDPYYLDMVINIVIVFYLNQRDVQQPFLPDHAAEMLNE